MVLSLMVPQFVSIRIRLRLGFTNWCCFEAPQIPLKHVLSIVLFDVSVNISRLVCVDFRIFVGLVLSLIYARVRASCGEDLILLVLELDLVICYFRNALPSAFDHLVFDRYFRIIHRLLRLEFPLAWWRSAKGCLRFEEVLHNGFKGLREDGSILSVLTSF